MKTICLILIFFYSSFASAQFDFDLKETSLELAEVQKTLKAEGVKEIFIGGGSARSILDFAFGRKDTLNFRDLDLVVPMGKEVTYKSAESVGLALESVGVGKYSPENLRPRPRFHTLTQKEYNAGFGFFVIGRESKILDLSLFHGMADVLNNGILSIDRIFIRVPIDSSLEKVFKKIKAQKYEESVKANLIVDPERGYENWIKKNPRILNSSEVNNKPFNVGVRIIRSFGKLGVLPLPKKEAKVIKNLPIEMNAFERFQGVRNILKLMDDYNWDKELGELARLGTLRSISTEFNNFIIKNRRDLKKFKAESSFDTLSNILLNLDKASVVSIVKILYKVDPIKALEFINTYNETNVRAKIRVSYFTGEFAPFHKGHLNVAEAPVRKGLTDIVFVIPTPHATNDPKVKNFNLKEWKERIAFTTAGTVNAENIVVLPDHRLVDLKKTKKLWNLIAALEEKLPTTKVSHIAGGDSLHRIIERKLYEKYPLQRFIVSRPGVPIPSEEILKKAKVKIVNGLKIPVSATLALHQMAADLVPMSLEKAVYNITLKTPRYQKIVNEYKMARKKLLSIKTNRFAATTKPTYILTPFQGYDGHYDEKPQPPTKELEKVLRSVVKDSYKEFAIHMPAKYSAYRKEWIDLMSRLGVSDYRFTARELTNGPGRVVLEQSGVANQLIKDGYLYEVLNRGGRVIVYEAYGVPASPLFEGVEGIEVQSKKTNTLQAVPMCKRLLLK